MRTIAGKKKTGKAIRKCFKERAAYWAGVRRDRRRHNRIFEPTALACMRGWRFYDQYRKHLYENQQFRQYRGLNP